MAEMRRHSAPTNGCSISALHHSVSSSAAEYEIRAETPAETDFGQSIDANADKFLPSLPDLSSILEGANYAELLNPADDAMLRINWADWDEFVRDAEGALDAIP